MLSETKNKVRNGVDVTALSETIAAIRQEPAIADFTFRLANEWRGGDVNWSVIEGFHGACAENRHESGPFHLANAEPPVLLGGGSAPNPVEFILHALAGCLTTTMVYHAASRGIEIRSVRTSLEGDLDLHGFLGLDETVRKGYQVIRATMHVSADTDPDKLASLAKYSPVYDTVSQSVPVELIVIAE